MILSSHGIIGSQITQFVGLLDDYSGASAAYSLRLLRSTYTGSAIKVRRSVGSPSEKDIGFVNNELDVADLESFCSGTDGFVVTWYDQSGNAIDASQATAASQPQIVSSGSVILENGKPSLDFDGSDDYLFNASSLTYNGGVSWYGVQNVVISSVQRLWCDDILGVQGYCIFYSDGRYQINDNGSGYETVSASGSIATQQLASFNFDDSNGNYNYAFDGSNTSGSISPWTGPIGTSGAANFGIMGAGNGAQYGNGNVQELVIYPNNQSSNRTGIETNINDFYSIY